MPIKILPQLEEDELQSIDWQESDAQLSRPKSTPLQSTFEQALEIEFSQVFTTIMVPTTTPTTTTVPMINPVATALE